MSTDGTESRPEPPPAPAPLSTEYEIPLTDDQFKDLGRFAAVFSQIDFLLNETISLFSKSAWWSSNIMLENVTTGGKLNMLRKVIKKSGADDESKHLAGEAADELARLLDKRNHVIHGMWMRQLVTPLKRVKPACFFHKFADDPVFAEELADLTKKGAVITRLLGDALTHLAPTEADRNPWTVPRVLHVTDRPVEELGWFLRDAELKKMGYPSPGGTLKAGPPRP